MSDPTPPLTSAPDYYPPVQVWVVHPPKQRYWLHAMLLLATFFTTLVVGARMEDNFVENRPVLGSDDDPVSFFPAVWALKQPSRLWLGIPFSSALMLILLAHEMGHYLYCKRYGVYATLPFFIPAPTLIGTLGAFIRIRSPIRSRTALFDIGVAGPIAGFLAATLVLLYSLPFSKPLAGASDVQLGYPLIFQLAHRLAAVWVPGSSHLPLRLLNPHPTAVAAWVGMFATALNLLPGGQLDGGHIVFSLVPRAHRFVSRLTILILIPLAVYSWMGWAVWAILLEISSFRHPQVADWPRVSGFRICLAAFALMMLIVTLTPAPFSHNYHSYSLREVLPLKQWLMHVFHR
jgi:membrane-associated protease RseP (regulator of RpoE activity)